MEGAVHPILDEIREEHDGDQLHQERQADDPLLQGRQRRCGRQPLRGGETDEREHLHHETADEVIKEVLTPFLTEERLLRTEGAEPLERNEDDAREQHVEREPVETEEERRRVGGQGARLGPAEQGRRKGGRRAEGAEQFGSAERETQGRCGET